MDEIKEEIKNVDKETIKIAEDIYKKISNKMYKFILIQILKRLEQIKRNETVVSTRNHNRHIIKLTKADKNIVKQIQQLVDEDKHTIVQNLIHEMDLKHQNDLLDSNRKMRVLRLPVTKEYFDQIEAGTKLIDFRELKHYWTSRLVDNKEMDGVKKFDIIEIKNGYGKVPTLLAKHIGTTLGKTPGSVSKTVKTGFCYSIHIGDIIRKENINQK